MALIGIYEAEPDDESEQHAPMRAETSDQPRPIERVAEVIHEVHDVGAVEALALLHERLRPDHFLRRTQFHRHAEHVAVSRIREPVGVDAGDRIAG